MMSVLTVTSTVWKRPTVAYTAFEVAGYAPALIRLHGIFLNLP